MNQSAAPYPHYFTGFIQDGNIYEQNYSGTQQIGVILSIYTALQKQHNELLEISESYKTRLIDLGEIEIPLTQDEIIQKLNEQLKESRAQLDQSQSMILKMQAQMNSFMEVSHERSLNTQSSSGSEQGTLNKNDTSVPNGSGSSTNQNGNSQSRKTKQRKNS